MEHQQNLSQDARRKVGDERAAIRRAERRDHLAEMNLIRQESGGDYEPPTREDAAETVERERTITPRVERHEAKSAAHAEMRLANGDFVGATQSLMDDSALEDDDRVLEDEF
ncbi:hypothetical protein [Nocardia sp. NPDC004722]